MRISNRSLGGFSLMELLVVVTILGILAAIIVPRISVTSKTAGQRADESNRVRINSAIERYYIEQGDWPADLSALAADPDYFPQGVPVDPVTGTPYTMNTTTHRVE